MATRSKSSKSSHKSNRNGISNCALILATVLAFLLAASVAVLLWKMFGLGDDFNRLCHGSNNKADVVAEVGESRVWKLYPGFFRTDTMQGRYENLRRANFNSSSTNTKTAGTCNFECGANEPTAPASVFRLLPGADRTTVSIPGRFLPRQNQSPPPRLTGGPFKDFVYHSCCSSGTRFVTPTKIRNLNNVEVEIVQDERYKQFFLEESCDRDNRCSGCTCGQPEPFIHTAVIHKNKQAETPEEMYEIDSIRIPGPCKCLNI